MTILIKSDSIIANPAGLTPSNPLWDPTYNNAILWWDGASGVATSGSSITGWTDKVAGVTASNSTTGTQPVTGTTMNGVPAPQFNSQHLGFSPPPGLTAVSVGFFAAVSVSAVNSTDGDYVISTPVGDIRVKTVSGNNNASGVLNASSSLQHAWTTQLAPHTMVIYQDSSDSLAHLRLDGVDVGSTALGTIAAWTSSGTLGNYWGSGHIDIAGTAMGAVGVLSGPQPLLNVQKLEGYLAQRFMAANFLPVGHPYRSVAPRRLT